MVYNKRVTALTIFILPPPINLDVRIGICSFLSIKDNINLISCSLLIPRYNSIAFSRNDWLWLLRLLFSILLTVSLYSDFRTSYFFVIKCLVDCTALYTVQTICFVWTVFFYIIIRIFWSFYAVFLPVFCYKLSLKKINFFYLQMGLNMLNLSCQ